jgi:hypothetical protein
MNQTEKVDAEFTGFPILAYVLAPANDHGGGDPVEFTLHIHESHMYGRDLYAPH